MKKDKKYLINNIPLMKEWDWDKNNKINLDPNILTEGSHKKAWWMCNKLHSWQATISHRTYRNDGCPYCANKKILMGFNDLETTHPYLIKEWNYNKNDTLLPNQVGSGSIQKVWWMCNKGHQWSAQIRHRANGAGCLYCSGQLPIVGENDLTTTHPQLASEWNYNKNGSLIPQDVKAYSHHKVWWKCKFEHEWEAHILNRAIKNENCPYCSGKRALKGYNDLTTTHPYLCDEWDYDKNGCLLPEHFTQGSGKKVCWICRKCGNSWVTSINTRTQGCGCPKCAKSTRTSFPEMCVYYYIKKYFNDAIWSYSNKELKISELDVFVPPNIGIEYDGRKYHQKTEKDIKKDKICYKLLC